MQWHCRGSIFGMLVAGLLAFADLAAAQSVSPSASLPIPLTLSLDDVIRRAEANEPNFAIASANQRALLLERKDARAALLPVASYHNQVIYTQPNGQSNRIGQTTNEPSPVFIANNAVREYASQAVINDTLGLAQAGAIRLADANAARANAELELARRGLIATVITLFYDAQTQADRVAVASRAFAEADHFVHVTEQREAARDSAHADVIKAQIGQQQRQREMAESQLALEKARLELGVLLFPDPATQYNLAVGDGLKSLPERASIDAAARKNNPELRSALASLQITQANTYVSRAALLPELGLNFTYGIDAPQFAHNGPEETRNLGYSASATLDLPLWDWLTSERKIKESRIMEGSAKTLVTAAQTRLLADLSEFYREAGTAQAELASLHATAEAAQESLRLTNLRYTNGEGTVLEVVDAQNTLILAENSELDGKERYQRALAQLQTLTGSL